AIVRETRGVECRAIDLQVQKEAKQHVVAKPLAELALTADAVQAHQQASFQQMLRRNRRPPHPRIHLVEDRRTTGVAPRPPPAANTSGRGPANTRRRSASASTLMVRIG